MVKTVQYLKNDNKLSIENVDAVIKKETQKFNSTTAEVFQFRYI